MFWKKSLNCLNFKDILKCYRICIWNILFCFWNICTYCFKKARYAPSGRFKLIFPDYIYLITLNWKKIMNLYQMLFWKKSCDCPIVKDIYWISVWNILFHCLEDKVFHLKYFIIKSRRCFSSRLPNFGVWKFLRIFYSLSDVRDFLVGSLFPAFK